MTKVSQQLIASFEALPEGDKHEVLVQLLRCIIGAPYASPSDEELTQAADLVFQDYDRHEAQG